MMENPNTLNSGMCRCCSSEGTFKDIKTKYHWMGEEEVYADMLTDCFDIKIQTPENMDNGICEVCITQLRNAANFKKQVLHTEEQFKKRLQNKDMKNPIKLESMEDSAGSDHLSDPDFSGNEYDIPIKEEVEEKPKAKKRSVKATTSRTKKPKNEPESSELRITIEPLKSGHEESSKPRFLYAASVDKMDKKGTRRKKDKKRKTGDLSARDQSAAEMAIHLQNFRTVMLCSNATPLDGFGGVAGFTCYFCSEQFIDPANLKTHTIKNHSYLEAPLKRIQLNNHLIKLDITGLTCKICFEAFGNLQPLIDHLRLEHNQPINTEVKNYMLPFRFGDEPLKCVFCSELSNNFRMALEHMNKHYRNFICETCDSGFVNRAAWRAHKRLTHEHSDNPCSQCHMVFDSATKLKNHIQGVHLKVLKIKCVYCDMKFNCLFAKNRHMQREHGVELPVAKCNACDKTFATVRNLTVHKKIYHLMERRHKCPICEKNYTDSNVLKKHLIVHTGVRDFKCEVCSKAFGRKSTLNLHMRIHNNDRRHKCQHCQMAFLHKCTLQKHLRLKHGTD